MRWRRPTDSIAAAVLHAVGPRRAFCFGSPRLGGGNHHLSQFAPMLNQRLLKPADAAAAAAAAATAPSRQVATDALLRILH